MFDVEGARKAGYSDAEIADHLAQSRRFDAAGARQAGYNDADLITHLTAQQPARQEGVLEGAASTVGQFGAGANRRIADIAGAPFDLVNRGLRAVGVPIPQGSVADALSRGINAMVGTPPAPRDATERFARGAGSGVVDALTMAIPATLAARATAPVGAAMPSTTNAVASALAVQPGAQIAAGGVGGGVGETTENPLMGAAAALATPFALGGAQRIITPVHNANSPARNALVRAAEAEGIPVTAGQATGNRFLQNVESQFEQLPFTAGPARAQREAAEEAFVRAAWRRAGENATDTLPDTINASRARIGGQIETIANRNTMQVTPQFENDLLQIEDSLRFLPAEAAGPVRARIDQLRGMMIQPPPNPPGTMTAPGQAPLNPTIPGASYRMMDSQLGRSIRSTSNGDLRAALGDLRDRLRVEMDNSIAQGATPDDAAAWQQARREYANLMTIANAAGRAGAGAAEGRMSPTALREAVQQGTGRGYAFGRGDLNELARIGQGVLRPPPDSGTAGRTAAQNLVTMSFPAAGAAGGAAAAGPVGAAIGAAVPVVAPRVVQALINSPAGQAYLRNQAMPNPVVTGALARALAAQQGTAYLTNPAP